LFNYAKLPTFAIQKILLSHWIALTNGIVIHHIMITDKINQEKKQECVKAILPVKDALEVLNGRWKIPIIISLKFGNKRFKEISRDVQGITDKVLSKELKALEVNQLIARTVFDTFPPTVEYSLTEHGFSLHNVITALGEWGTSHREKIIGK